MLCDEILFGLASWHSHHDCLGSDKGPLTVWAYSRRFVCCFWWTVVAEHLVMLGAHLHPFVFIINQNLIHLLFRSVWRHGEALMTLFHLFAPWLFGSICVNWLTFQLVELLFLELLQLLHLLLYGVLLLLQGSELKRRIVMVASVSMMHESVSLVSLL